MSLISRNLLPERPQELGHIKIGGKGAARPSRGGSTFQPPVKFNHFVVTTRERDQTGNFVRDAAIHEKLGTNEPRELEGLLMYETPEENFHSEMAVYVGRSKNGKVSTCNGERVTFLQDVQRTDLPPIPKGAVAPCNKAAGKACACKPYGRLHLQLWSSPNTLGYHVFRTTSWASTNNIQSALEQIYRTFGTCYHAPVKLVLYSSEDKREDATSTSYKVALVLAMPVAEVARKIGEARQYVAVAGGDTKLLAAAVRADLDAVDTSQAEEIAAEFFPEADAAVTTTNRAAEVAAALRADDEPETVEAEWVHDDEDPGMAAEDAAGTTNEPETANPAPRELDEATRAVNARYFATLAQLGMSGESDRRAFQKRLHASGLVGAESCKDWNRQDYRSALAELDIIAAGEGK